MKNTKEFTIKKGDEEVKLMVRKPRMDELREAQKVQTRAFRDAIESGAVLRVKLDEVLESQGLWDKAKDIEIKTLQKEIIDLEMKLRAGGLKVSVGKDLAFDIIKKRDRIKEIFAVKLLYDGKTAEAQADDAKTDYLLSVCLVYNDAGNKPYFKNLEEYLNNQNDLAAIEGYRNFLMLLNDHDEDNYEKNFVEYKFLKRFKMVDEKLRLINKDGQLVDRHGNLIDENGRFIKYDSEGNKSFVDINGNPVNAEGEYDVKEEPFLDDDGNEIVE
jgi:hypothetical protein